MDVSYTPISNDPSETSSSCAIYKNHPLGSNETRVIKIMPSTSTDGSDLISLRLSVISLGNVIPLPPPRDTVFDSLPYHAVSYMWGDPSPTKNILVDGELLAVRMNIWDFLLQKRKEQCQDSLWIDSICINQEDTSERGHQVAVMGQIYSKAAEVRVWLGAGTEEHWLGMQRLSEIDWYTFDHHGGLCRQGPSRGFGRHPLDCRICDVLPPSISPEEFVAPAIELCKLPYWSRMWIAQECFLARQLKIQCGPFVIDVGTLDYFRLYSKLLLSAEDSPTAFEILFLRTSGTVSAGSIHGFLILFKYLLRHQCSDPRDHIYAILSLNAFASGHIVPDYTKSAPELFLTVLALLKGLGWFSRTLIDYLQQALQLSDDCDEVKSALAAADLRAAEN